MITAMKEILLVAVAAAVACASPAQATLQQDDTFYNAIDHYGIPISHRDAWVAAQTVCTFMGEGYEFWAVSHNLENDHPDWTPDDVGHFAGAAVVSYCPQLEPK